MTIDAIVESLLNEGSGRIAQLLNAPNEVTAWAKRRRSTPGVEDLKAVIKPGDDPSDRAIVFSEMYLTKEAQGKGLGTKLMRELQAIATKLNLPIIALGETKFSKMGDLWRWHKKMGFKKGGPGDPAWGLGSGYPIIWYPRGMPKGGHAPLIGSELIDSSTVRKKLRWAMGHSNYNQFNWPGTVEPAFGQQARDGFQTSVEIYHRAGGDPLNLYVDWDGGRVRVDLWTGKSFKGFDYRLSDLSSVISKWLEERND